MDTFQTAGNGAGHQGRKASTLAKLERMRQWEIDTIDRLESAEFDDPTDRRRFFDAGDNQIAGVGDGFERNSPPWLQTVESLRPDFPVYGSIIEASECLTRLVGQQGGDGRRRPPAAVWPSDRLIFQSDHSVASDVSGPTYDYVVKLVREYGRYPLALGEHTIDDEA